MTTLNSIGLVIAGAVVGALASMLMAGHSFGGVYSQTKQFFTEIEVSSTATVSGDATVSGGTLTVTTANAATSTIIGGCFQFYATSTATAHKFQASTTPGIMFSVYGTCPNL
jgi:hypothetical protein